MIGGDEVAAPPARPGRGRGVRPAPGHLVLADGPSARVRLPAHRPFLPRVLLRAGRPPAGRPGAVGVAGPPRGRGPGRAAAVIPTLIVFAYLALVVYIGVFAFRRGGTQGAEEYFLASRSLGP